MLDKQVGVYTVAEEIGRGSFAVVSKGYHMVLPLKAGQLCVCLHITDSD